MAGKQLRAGINYAFIYNNFDWDNNGSYNFLLQGSSGSGKTFDALIFIITYCTNYKNKGLRILISRETYSATKDTVLADFIRILKDHGLYDEKYHVQSHPQKYILEGNTISFKGRDESSSHGQRNDLIYFNELMNDDNSSAFDQLEGRLSGIFIADYNPKYTAHWVYDKIKSRPDVKFLKTTFLTCAFLPPKERLAKLRYEPTHPEDRRLPMKDRRPHPVNIAAGTADEYMWRVYGEGEAAAAEGIIFQHVTWIDRFPDGMGFIYGMDFGYTVDPCVIVKYAEDDYNIWAEWLSYEPMETPEAINEHALATGLNVKTKTFADSSDKHISENKGAIEFVKGLKALGWSNIEKVKKTKSIMYWITSMKKKKIHIVQNQYYKEAKREQENYRLKTINGFQINQPIDKFNHGWDGTRYGHIGWNTKKQKAFW